MQEIKVFLASSEELDVERKEIADLVLNLNDIYSEKGILIRLYKWEYMGKSYNGVRKQDEYNEVIRNCDIFLGLFYTKAGEFTEEEFDVAVDQYKKSRKTPLILVFLKDLMPSEREDESLKSFKTRLATGLGHYWARFSHTDKLKLDIVLQLQRFDLFGQSGQVYVKDSNIFLADGTLVASLENLSFASNNQQWNQMKAEVAKLERQIKRYSMITDLDESELADFVEMKKELKNKQETLQSIEMSMFNTALAIAQSVGTKSSERLKKAQEYFEKGDVETANIVLDYQQIMADTENNKQLYEQEQKILEVRRENLLLNIHELRMKISLLIGKNIEETIEEDLKNALNAFEKIIEICETIKLEDSERWSITIDILNQFYESNKCASEFIIYFAWECIHGLKEDSKSMGYELSYRFIIKCILIISKSIKGEREYPQSLILLLKLALEYNGKVYDGINIERADILALIGDYYYHKYYKTSFRYDDEILSYCYQAKEIREKLLGPSHPDTINICSNIAYYLHRMFRVDQAVEIMNGLIENISENYNEYRPKEGIYIIDSRFNIESVHYVFNTALFYGNYADLLQYLDRFADAIKYYEKALDVAKSDYNSLCGYMARMGRCYMEQGVFTKGIECMMQSLKMASAESGVDYTTEDDRDFYWYWAICADSDGMSFPLVRLIAIAYYKMGNIEESLKYHTLYLNLILHAERMVKSQEDSYDMCVPDIVEAYTEKGFLHLQLNQYDQSIEDLENALGSLRLRKDYYKEAPSILKFLIEACTNSRNTVKASTYEGELSKITKIVEEDPLSDEPTISTLVIPEDTELPNITLSAGDYTLLKYGEFEIGNFFPFDKTMQDEGIKELIILQNRTIKKYFTSLAHCDFTLRTSIAEAESLNLLLEELKKFKSHDNVDKPLYDPFVYTIKINKSIDTACGHVIPSGVYPIYKYGAFEVGKFQMFDAYIRDYDLPQITIMQIGSELHSFWVCLKECDFSLFKTYKYERNVVKQHVEKLCNFLGDKYIIDEPSVFLTIGHTIKFDKSIQLGKITLPCDESYILIKMGDYEIGNLNEPNMLDVMSFIIYTNDYGFIQIDSNLINGLMDFVITTHQVEKNMIEKIKNAYNDWKHQEINK